MVNIKTRTIIIIISLATLGVMLSSCSPIVRPDQINNTGLEELSDTRSIGQTFVPNHKGLTGIEVFLKPTKFDEGEVTLSIMEDPSSNSIIASSSLKAELITESGYYQFLFPTIKQSSNNSYYLQIQIDNPGLLKVKTGDAGAYINGAMYIDGDPIERQLVFRTVYDPISLVTGLMLEALTWVYYFLAFFFAITIPGLAILSSIWKEWKSRHWLEIILLSTTIGLALYPLLLLWLNVFSIRIGRYLPFVLPIGSIFILIWKNKENIKNRNIGLKSFTEKFKAIDILLILVIVLIFLPRAWVIRTLDVPMFGDSYQHTLMAQLIVDNDGLFDSWQPYAELTSFTYHYGFHTTVSVFHWITKLPIEKSVLIIGQLINGLAVLILFPITRRISQSNWAGVFAIFLAGLVFSMPMYYVNWGRYTQLIGQFILLGLIYLLVEHYQSEKDNKYSWLVIAILLAGLFVTHYRVFIFAVIFIFVYWVMFFRKNTAVGIFRKTFIYGLVSIILVSPWLLNLFGGVLQRIFTAQISTIPQNVETWVVNRNNIGNLLTYLPGWAWLILPVIIGLGLWKKKKEFALICLWWFFLILAAYPEWIKLPGTGVLTGFAIQIALYIPAGILLGCVFSDIVLSVMRVGKGKYVSTIIPAGIAIGMLVLGVLGVKQRIHDLDIPKFALVTKPDIIAADWIVNNTTEDAKFLTNSFFAYGGSLIAGSDAGWWLPKLTGRDTTLPPLVYGSETGITPDYRLWINFVTAEIQKKGIDDPEVIALLKSRGVTHVYVGQQQGSVNNRNPQLVPEDIVQSVNYETIYNRDRVWIFEIRYP